MLRQNFGIMIERVAALEVGSSEYTQVFTVDYPTLEIPLYSHTPMKCRKIHTKWFPICKHANKILH